METRPDSKELRKPHEASESQDAWITKVLAHAIAISDNLTGKKVALPADAAMPKQSERIKRCISIYDKDIFTSSRWAIEITVFGHKVGDSSVFVYGFYDTKADALKVMSDFGITANTDGIIRAKASWGRMVRVEVTHVYAVYGQEITFIKTTEDLIQFRINGKQYELAFDEEIRQYMQSNFKLPYPTAYHLRESETKLAHEFLHKAVEI